MENKFLTGTYKTVFFSGGGLTLFACLLTVIIFPIYIHILPPFMILWILFWLFENKSRLNKNMFRKNKPAVLFILFLTFFLWQISGLMWAESVGTGLERIFKRLGFICFPLVLFYPGEGIKNNINMILRLFVIGTLAYLIICFVNALNHSLIIEGNKWLFRPNPPDYRWENYFFGERLSYFLHPSYLSMYIVLSILILFESIFGKTTSTTTKVFLGFVIGIFIIALYLLSARAGILAGIIVIPSYCLLKWYRLVPWWILLLAISLIVFIFITAARNNARVINSLENISDHKIELTFKTDARLLIWKSALGVIGKNLWFGVGTGDATNELKDEFISRGYKEGYYDNMNAHNQFLEILLENGVIGLILFLAILGYMAYLAKSQRNILLGLFVLLIAIFFLFETMMNRLSGITFFSIFSFLLIYSENKSLTSKDSSDLSS